MIVGLESTEPPQPKSGDVWFLESLDRVNRAIQTAPDLESMMRAVLDAVLAIFDVDRAWLVLPCDPGAPSFTVPMERTKPEFPGANALGQPVPMHPDIAEVYRAGLGHAGPIQFGPDAPMAVPPTLAEVFQVRSGLGLAIYPKGCPSYMFGLHQCSAPRVWSGWEERLFEEIGRRLSDALTALTAHAALRENERRLLASQQLAGVGHWEANLVSGEVTMSAEACRILGLSPEPRTAPSNEWMELWFRGMSEKDRLAALEALEALDAGKRFEHDYACTLVSGEVRFIHSVADVKRDARGRAELLLGVMQDVTSLRKAEVERRISDQRYRILVEHAADGLFLHGPEGLIEDVNQMACDQLGYSREELIGGGVALFDRGLTPADLSAVNDLVAKDELAMFESIHQRKDGTRFPVEIRIRPFLQEGRRMCLSLARDVSRRKQTELELRRSLNLLESVVEGTDDAIFVKDLEGRYLMINSAGAKVIGKTPDEVIGRHDHELFESDDVAGIVEQDRLTLESGKTSSVEVTLSSRGALRTFTSTKGVYLDEDGKAMGLIGIAHDTTEQKRLELELRQAQKMEAIGRLAGGIAHDFNNLLTVMNGCTELLYDALGPDDGQRDLLSEVLRAGERAAELTSQLLAFSRKQVLVARVIDLNQVLGELHKMLGRLIGEDVELRLVPCEARCLANIDRGQFEQAIVNLAVNARHAMPRGGRLTLTVRCESEHVHVEVIDTGTGMDEETKARAFEPFFSTKGPGGTGLGLAMVYGFVTQSGGRVEIDSQPGLGATIRIRLPRVDEEVSAPIVTADKKPRTGHETILLVEDSDQVRTFARHVLEAHGYKVIEASDGSAALAILRDRGHEIPLIVSDIVMPNMTGRELADEALAMHPGIHVLLISGYTDESIAALAGSLPAGRPTDATGVVGFLQKPFSPVALAIKVGELLDGPS